MIIILNDPNGNKIAMNTHKWSYIESKQHSSGKAYCQITLDNGTHICVDESDVQQLAEVWVLDDQPDQCDECESPEDEAIDDFYSESGSDVSGTGMFTSEELHIITNPAYKFHKQHSYRFKNSKKRAKK